MWLLPEAHVLMSQRSALGAMQAYARICTFHDRSVSKRMRVGTVHDSLQIVL